MLQISYSEQSSPHPCTHTYTPQKESSAQNVCSAKAEIPVLNGDSEGS